MKAEDKTIAAAEIKFIRTGKCTWMDCKIEKDILKKLEIEPTLDKILKYKTSQINMLTECKEIDFPDH
jgi:hypothetical protein